jgi:hypothetical protein
MATKAIIKIIGGVVLAAAIILGAAACGSSSHSFISARRSPTPMGDADINNLSDTYVFTTVAQYNSVSPSDQTCVVTQLMEFDGDNSAGTGTSNMDVELIMDALNTTPSMGSYLSKNIFAIYHRGFAAAPPERSTSGPPTGRKPACRGSGPAGSLPVRSGQK